MTTQSAAYEYDIGDELNRKSGEAYSWLDSEYQRGQIEPSSYHLALVCLDLALLGLIPEEYSEWACSKRKELALQRDIGNVYSAFKGNTVVIVKADRAAPTVTVTAIIEGRRTDKIYLFEDCPDPYKAADQRFTAVIDKLTANGYEEV